MFCSIHKIDFEETGVTSHALVDFGDDVLDVPGFAGTQEVEVAPLLRGAYPFIQVRGNVARVVTFTRVYDFADRYLAKQFELTHMQLLDTMGMGRLKVQVQTQDARWINGAALVGEPLESDELLATQVAFTYTVTGKSITSS